jgi:hypothetical protein
MDVVFRLISELRLVLVVVAAVCLRGLPVHRICRLA